MSGDVNHQGKIWQALFSCCLGVPVLEEVMAYESDEKPDILIVTVTQVEQDAVLRNFKTLAGESIQRGAYLDLGIINHARIWMVISGMGSDGVTGSSITLQKAIDDLSPKAVIMVGIAFGVNEQKQQIGGILVSEFIVPYENQRIGKTKTELRGARPPASPELVSIFKTAAAKWREEEGTAVEFGPILSGNKLIDNLQFRDNLVKASSAIGGEMEGAGLCFVASAKKTDWILVKGICDWADGNKSQDKANRQAMAAENAARFTLYILRKNVLAQPGNYIPAEENLLSNPPVDRMLEHFNESVENVMDLVTKSQYREAHETAVQVREEIIRTMDRNRSDVRLLLGELDVWDAHVLQYLGKIQTSLQLLQRIKNDFSNVEQQYQDKISHNRWCNVLGRAYNHTGYINWISLGHYETALRELKQAVRILSRGHLEKELATALDNLGRVYAQLGYQTRSKILNSHSFRLRSNDNDRKALSSQSLAMSLINFGQPDQALLEIEKAFDLFDKASNKQRGKGLALIIKGQALRHLGAQEYPNPQIKKIEYLKGAIDVLNQAKDIFRNNVDEEIKLIQINHELGCAFRERAVLFRQDGDMDKALPAAEQSKNYLEAAMKSALGEDGEYKYRVHYVAACEEMAQLSTLMADDAETKKWIVNAQEAILPQYKYMPGTRPTPILPDECYEDFWLRLGNIELITAQMILMPQQKQLSKEASLQAAIEHYILAAGYVGRFSRRPLAAENHRLYPHYSPHSLTHQRFIENWYDYIKDLGAEQLARVKDIILPEVTQKYELEPVWLDELIVDSLEFLL